MFFLIIVISTLFLINNSKFQRSKYLLIVQEATGYVNSVSNTLFSYLNLKTNNDELNRRIAELEMESQFLQDQLYALTDTIAFSAEQLGEIPAQKYHYIPAKIIKKQIAGIDNFMTLNKGSDAGVKIDMGVVAANGIVGVVTNVSPNFSKIIPVVNPLFRPNCKVSGDNYAGPLIWDGKDLHYSYLEELPRHAPFQIGDTIVTSGYSGIFPEGVNVGIVVDSQRDTNDDFKSLKVELFVDFFTVNDVLIINNTQREEQLNLEQNKQ